MSTNELFVITEKIISPDLTSMAQTTEHLENAISLLANQAVLTDYPRTLGEIMVFQNAMLHIRSQLDIAELALAELGILFGVDTETNLDYANDQLPEH